MEGMSLAADFSLIRAQGRAADLPFTGLQDAGGWAWTKKRDAPVNTNVEASSWVGNIVTCPRELRAMVKVGSGMQSE